MRVENRPVAGSPFLISAGQHARREVTGREDADDIDNDHVDMNDGRRLPAEHRARRATYTVLHAHGPQSRRAMGVRQEDTFPGASSYEMSCESPEGKGCAHGECFPTSSRTHCLILLESRCGGQFRMLHTNASPRQSLVQGHGKRRFVFLISQVRSWGLTSRLPQDCKGKVSLSMLTAAHNNMEKSKAYKLVFGRTDSPEIRQERRDGRKTLCSC